MSEEQHMALPRLYGAPAYSRPPRPAEVLVRPFDPDELPLEAERTEEDLARASELTGATWTPTITPPVKARGRRGRAAKQAATQAARDAATQAATHVAVPVGAAQATPPSQDGQPAGLQGRPFSLRGLGRIFGSDRK